MEGSRNSGLLSPVHNHRATLLRGFILYRKTPEENRVLLDAVCKSVDNFAESGSSTLLRLEISDDVPN